MQRFPFAITLAFFMLALATTGCGDIEETPPDAASGPHDDSSLDQASHELRGSGLPGGCRDNAIGLRYNREAETNWIWGRGYWHLQFVYYVQPNPCWIAYHGTISTNIGGQHADVYTATFDRRTGRLEILISSRMFWWRLRGSMRRARSVFHVWAYYNR